LKKVDSWWERLAADSFRKDGRRGISGKEVESSLEESMKKRKEGTARNRSGIHINMGGLRKAENFGGKKRGQPAKGFSTIVY